MDLYVFIPQDQFVQVLSTVADESYSLNVLICHLGYYENRVNIWEISITVVNIIKLMHLIIMSLEEVFLSVFSTMVAHRAGMK